MSQGPTFGEQREQQQAPWAVSLPSSEFCDPTQHYGLPLGPPRSYSSEQTSQTAPTQADMTVYPWPADTVEPRYNTSRPTTRSTPWMPPQDRYYSGNSMIEQQSRMPRTASAAYEQPPAQEYGRPRAPTEYTGRRDDPTASEDLLDMRGASYPGQEWVPERWT